ncbi:hypothetical protein H0H93_007928 [Arthromyces matolae]|nr:hypothetical protein H0H93_007928 [Arthromyces matolae]
MQPDGLVDGLGTDAPGNSYKEPTMDQLERELPVVMDGQIPLGDLLSRITQAIYAELAELAETMPNMSDSARKRILADWVVKTKKQAVKLYAVVKWSRDAETVQKCMNITAFLMTQNHQFEGALEALKPPADGRVYFAVPKLFEASLCLRGAQKDDGWFFVHVEFLINIGGDLAGLQDFPRIPAGMMKRHITDEADARLAFYLTIPDDHQNNLEQNARNAKPQLPSGIVDAPLVRVYNFLQSTVSDSFFGGTKVAIIGMGGLLNCGNEPESQNFDCMLLDVRRQQPPPHRQNRVKLPLLGGTVTISIVDSPGSSQAGPGPARSPTKRVFARLQRKAKLGEGLPSDEVEGLKLQVHWEPTKGALGVIVSSTMPDHILHVDADNLDFESLLRAVIARHAFTVLEIFQSQLQNGLTRTVFSPSGVVTLVKDGSHSVFFFSFCAEITSESVYALRVHLCADEVVIMTIDSRTGRLNLRDTGDLAAAGRGPRFTAFSEQLNENPQLLFPALMRLRLMTITDLAEQKADYLGLQSFRRRNFQPDELLKLGPSTRGTLYLQLSHFPNHYLVLVITDDRFRYALITTRVMTESMYAHMVMEDIAWLDFDRIHGEEVVITSHTGRSDSHSSEPNGMRSASSGFDLETPVLRELYSYCCARVAFMNVERQFKLRGIPFTHVNPSSGAPVTVELAHIQSSLARSVPALCVQSQDILSGAPAAEAAMPNIRVIPLNWWSEKNAQVVTSVKLKYVQQPMGKTAGTTAVIRPSKRIIYDTTQAVVSFLSENVNTCVDEFLEEWARVSKMVVIAREVAQMAKESIWDDVCLLSFDLQTVEFAYAQDYTVSISCQDQLSPIGGNFDLRFSRRTSGDKNQDLFNPHDDAEPFLRNILRHGHGRLAPSLHRLVTLLRETLPIVTVLEDVRQQSDSLRQSVDTFAKAAGWYRLLYSNLMYALDFRLMNDQRVAILDASYSVFDPASSKSPIKTSEEAVMSLKPIPKFSEIVANVVKSAVLSGSVQPGTVALMDVGIICDAVAVSVLGKLLHENVVIFNS